MDSLLFNQLATSTPGVIIACTFFFLLILCSYLVIESKAAGLSRIPGPWLAQFTNIWALHFTWRTNRAGTTNGGQNKVSKLMKLRAVYGDVVRTGPRMVVVFDPAAVPMIYGVRSKLNKARDPSIKVLKFRVLTDTSG